MTESCRLCGEATQLYMHGLPLCLDCDTSLNSQGVSHLEKLRLLRNAPIEPPLSLTVDALIAQPLYLKAHR